MKTGSLLGLAAALALLAVITAFPYAPATTPSPDGPSPQVAMALAHPHGNLVPRPQLGTPLLSSHEPTGLHQSVEGLSFPRHLRETRTLKLEGGRVMLEAHTPTRRIEREGAFDHLAGHEDLPIDDFFVALGEHRALRVMIGGCGGPSVELQPLSR